LPALLWAARAAVGPARAQPVRLIAIGDFGVGGTAERSFGAAVRRFEARSPAEALVSLGDSDSTASPEAFHENWDASFRWLGAARVEGGRRARHHAAR